MSSEATPTQLAIARLFRDHVLVSELSAKVGREEAPSLCPSLYDSSSLQGILYKGRLLYYYSAQL